MAGEKTEGEGDGGCWALWHRLHWLDGAMDFHPMRCEDYLVGK